MVWKLSKKETIKFIAVEKILTRAAEQLGDITPLVMSAYYERLPKARELFEFHDLSEVGKLEGEMVERALYCLMYWYQSPGEIEMLLLNSVPHHSETLKVPANIYKELLNCTAAIIAATIPTGNSEETSIWTELCSDLEKVIDMSGQ